MGTHPIFESDFDCLTDMRIFAFVAGFSTAFNLDFKGYNTFLKSQSAEILQKTVRSPIVVRPFASQLWILNDDDLNNAQKLEQFKVGLDNYIKNCGYEYRRNPKAATKRGFKCQK